MERSNGAARRGFDGGANIGVKLGPEANPVRAFSPPSWRRFFNSSCRLGPRPRPSLHDVDGAGPPVGSDNFCSSWKLFSVPALCELLDRGTATPT